MVARMSHAMNDFLALAALSTLLLSGVGMMFLFSAHIQTKFQSVALLNSLGLGKTKCFLIYALQAQVLGLLSFILSLGFSLILLPVLKNFASHWMTLEFDFQIFTFQWAFLLSMLVPFCVSLISLNGLRRASFFQLLYHELFPFFRKKNFILFGLICGALIYLMAIGLSRSLILGTWFFCLFLLAGLLLSLCAFVLLVFSSFFEKIFLSKKRRKNPLSFWILRDIKAHLPSYLTIFISLGMCLMLLNLPYQIENSLSKEFNAPQDESQLPSLFLFDIQEDQKEKLKTLLQENHLKAKKIMPLVTAKILFQNKKAYQKGQGVGSKSFTKEKRRQVHLKNRSFNLSEGRPNNILKGKDFSQSHYKDRKTKALLLPSISLEHRFAKTMGLNIGDTLSFEIEGEKLRGKVKNLRQVDWLSFQPNFFVLFQEGSLNDFSKTYVASLPTLPKEIKHQIQNEIVKQFPNISIVDVSFVSKKLFLFISQAGLGFQMMSVLCLVAGLIVLFSLSFWHGRGRKKDIGLLKALGMDFKSIKALFMLPFLWVSGIALILGAGCSVLLSYIVCTYIFLIQPSLGLFLPLVSTSLMAFFVWKVVDFALKDSLKTPGSRLLNSS